MKAEWDHSPCGKCVKLGEHYPLELTFELLMAELTKPDPAKGDERPRKSERHGGGLSSARSSTILLETPPQTPLFTRIAQTRIHVLCSPQSHQLHAYYPVTFTPTNFCQLDVLFCVDCCSTHPCGSLRSKYKTVTSRLTGQVTIHTALINLKFRKRAYSRQAHATTTENSIVPSRHFCNKALQFKPRQHASFKQLLFQNSRAHHAVHVRWSEIQAMYRAYLQPLLRSIGATSAALRSLESMMLDLDSSTEARGSWQDTLNHVHMIDPSATLSLEECSEHVDLGSPSRSSSMSTRLANDSYSFRSSLNNPCDVERVAALIERSLKMAAHQCFVLWGRLVTILPQHRCGGHMRVAGRLRRSWLDIERRWWLRFVTASSVKIQKIMHPHDERALAMIFAGTRLRMAGENGSPRSALHAFDPIHVAGEHGLGASSMAVCHQTFYTRGEIHHDAHDSLRGSMYNVLVADEIEASDAQRAPFSAMGRDTSQPHSPPGLPLLASYKGPHLVVLQHGWYATSHDMRLLQSYIKLLFPKAVVFTARSNEENSSLPIAKMGTRLAHEVRNFIAHNFPALGNLDQRYGRISFIGHSIGSVIIRAAIASPSFAPFKAKLHTFITISSSHCGNKYMTSTLVSGGMWAIMQLQKSTLLEELQLTDAAQNSDAFIYRLSQEEGLEHFQFVVLVASRQDTYVPLHSAHIQIPRPAEVDNALDGGMYIDMARNLLAPILKSEKKQTTVIRLTLDQKFTARSVDTFIGRAAHVAMLETPSLVLLLLFSLYNILC
mmetsp:Transcript_25486/g.82466  ORF Transcript_25486/g.82466 Transcript_25486/m.82466 type:complete len:776 (-) Transcript_25486:384-2711(-)